MGKVSREKTNYDYTMEELSDKRAYTIKNLCFLCGIKIKNCWDYFTRYGNCCIICSARVSRIALKHKGNPIKAEEALMELADRRRLVQAGKLKRQV